MSGAFGQIPAWKPIETAPYAIPVLCVWENGTQMVAYLDFMDGWLDAETREELGFDPTHWMMLPSPPSKGHTE